MLCSLYVFMGESEKVIKKIIITILSGLEIGKDK